MASRVETCRGDGALVPQDTFAKGAAHRGPGGALRSWLAQAVGQRMFRKHPLLVGSVTSGHLCQAPFSSRSVEMSC